VIGVLAENGAPNALAGAVTGIGFIGGGLVFRQDLAGGEVLHGVTTAAAIFATAGEGRLFVAALATALVLLSLELQHVPGLRFLDARRWQSRFAQDASPSEAAKPPEKTPPQRQELVRMTSRWVARVIAT